MIPPGYTDALVVYANSRGAVGIQAINDEFDTLFAEITAGNGKEVISAGINGKSFGWSVSITVEEKFSAFGDAISRLTDSPATTYPDFSQIGYIR
jgi:hypothetical protein